jgi:hypothetical protein
VDQLAEVLNKTKQTHAFEIERLRRDATREREEYERQMAALMEQLAIAREHFSLLKGAIKVDVALSPMRHAGEAAAGPPGTPLPGSSLSSSSRLRMSDVGAVSVGRSGLTREQLESYVQEVEFVDRCVLCEVFVFAGLMHG